MSRADRSRLPEAGALRPFVFPAVHRQGTVQGLDLWCAPVRTLPLITFSLLVRAGSSDDFEGYEGLAAFAADMIDEGTGNLSAIDVNQAFARLGTHLETDVTADATIFTVTVLSRFARRTVSLMADCITRPRFEPADFERLRELRLTRLVQLRDLPSAIADRAFMQVVYGAHPYSHMPLGTEESLKQLTVDGARAFWERRYRPSRATFVAAGDIGPDEFAALAAETFRGWTETPHAHKEDDAALVPPPAIPAHRCVIINKPGAAQAEIRVGQVGQPRSTPDYFPLIVLNTIIGGQFISRINMSLRQERGLTYGARTAFDFRRGPGPFMLQTSVQSSGAGEAVRVSRHELEAVRGERPPASGELDVAKGALTRGYARNFETPDQLARAMIQRALYELRDDYFDRFAAEVDAVTLDQVSAAARNHLDPDRLAVAVVADASVVEDQLRDTPFGEPVPLLPRL